MQSGLVGKSRTNSALAMMVSSFRLLANLQSKRCDMSRCISENVTSILRLRDREISRILDFKVPKLWHADDELWVIEMEIVSPPFVLDFAGAYLDSPPDFPEEIMADWRAEKKEQFGERWPQVQDIMREFRKLGIYLADVKPGNIMFRE
jgi:hypothetical protein